jgi:hypothetical protein
VLTHAALGRLLPGDPVTVSEGRAGRTGAATYIGFYADDDVRTLVPLVVIEWPDGSREVASEAALAPPS